MRTHIDIDEKLMAATMQVGGFSTKKETVDSALRPLARRAGYKGVRAVRSTVKREGDLAAMQRD